MEYKTILTAHLFLPVFEVISPISRYVQTKGLDFLRALNMLGKARKDLEIISFESSKEKAMSINFVSMVQGLLETTLMDLEISSELPACCIAKKKLMAGETEKDFRPEYPEQPF